MRSTARTKTPPVSSRMPESPARGRAGLPVLATAVPILGAVGLWAVTGSVLSLWFAALAPLMAIAGVGDRLLAVRRARRRDAAAAAEESASLHAAVQTVVAQERERAWRRTPDIGRYLDQPHEMWREISGRQGQLLLGTGDARVSLSADRLAEVRTELAPSETIPPRAPAVVHTMPDAPIVVPLRGRIEVVGPEPLVAGAVRAMILQLCLAHPPGRLELTGELPREFSWVEMLPHRVTPGQRRVALAVAEGWGVSATEVDATILVGGAGGGGDVLVRLCQSDTGVPHATVDTGEESASIRPQMLSEVQAVLVARSLRERTASSTPDAAPLALDALIGALPASVPGAGIRTLASVVGSSGAAPFSLDLVNDGPHALVVGTTGSGKSELLRTWVASMAARYAPEDVVFVLADFKGGTAFASLRRLPHVTGVLTDLDAAAATRGLESLRAEIRRRESVLAASGIRDIAEGTADLPRLVVVVDEFATLLNTHADLAALFIDLTARGRALGIHVVLGTQRATGVFRDALLANCLLRVVLRAADAADSRLMIGEESAARMPAGARGAGIALVRRAGDARPVPVRVAMTGDELIARVSDRPCAAPIRAPWMEPLPDTVLFPTPREDDGRLLIGLADEPHLQRQEPIGVDRRARGVCVIGTSGSGVTTALQTVLAQVDRLDAWVGAGDLEAAWDDLTRVAASRHGAVVVDGADAILAAFPPEYAHAAVGLLETIARASGEDRPLLLGLERLTGPLARVADLLPHRLLLRHAQRTDYLASGGAPGHHDPAAPAGRGLLDGTVLQVFRIDKPPERAQGAPSSAWKPPPGITGWVTRSTPSAERVQIRWQSADVTVRSAEEVLGAGASPMAEPGGSLVIRAEPEQWQRLWAPLTTLRAQGPVLIDQSCAGEYRLLTGRRELPPLCTPGADRGWLLEPGRAVRRVRLD